MAPVALLRSVCEIVRMGSRPLLKEEREITKSVEGVRDLIRCGRVPPALLRAVWRTGHHHAAPAGPVAGLSLGASHADFSRAERA